MGTLSKAERKALDELFLTIHEKRNFLTRLKNSRKDMQRLFKSLIKTQKIHTKQA
ncbi:hypothetical protein ACKGJI_07105 [Sulfurospirillum sp. 1307]|jgi:5-bromo-4-chloroindolyl phosphate hydrolysis protein